MKVEFFRHQLSQINLDRLAKVAGTIFLTTGQEAALFEERFASHLNQKQAVGLTSATAALHLSLLALGVGPGDEVITTPLTFVATALSVMHVGAKPVFVEVEPDTGNLDAARIEAAITDKTRAVLPVHLYGQMVDVRLISQICRAHGLALIEDAAQCLEGERDQIRVGQLAEAACFSFYATKSITCGEGGAVTTDDPALAEAVRKLRLHGLTSHAAERYTKLYRHYDVDVEGWKYNMSNLQAALLIDQLERVEEWRLARERVVSKYRQALTGLPGLDLPALRPGVKQGHNLFTIWVHPDKRDRLVWRLQEEGVGVAVNYQPCHLFTLFRQRYGLKEGDFPEAELIGRRTISLPLYPSLKDEEIEYVIDAVKKVVREGG